jgi:hypothetical protein
MNSVVADVPPTPAVNTDNFTIVESNNINFTNTAVQYKKAGISAENCKHVFLQSNTITGTSVADNSTWTTGHYFPAAIQLAGTQNATLCGNSTDNIRTGILFNGTCSGSTLTLNNINQHQTGLYYRPNVVLDAQTDGGNTFQNGYNYSDAGARNMAVEPVSGTVPGQVQVNPSGSRNGNPFWTNNQKTTTAAIQTWFSTTSTPTPNPAPICTNTPTLANLSYSEQIAAGLINTNEFPAEMEWWAKKNLYEDLSKQGAQSSSILQNFKDSIEYTPTGELTDVKNDAVTLFTPSETYKLQCANYETQLGTQKESIANLQAQAEADPANAANYEAQLSQATALFEMTRLAYENLQATQKVFESNAADNLKAQNAAIQPVLLQEFNQKAVNDIYFSTIPKGLPLNTTGRGANHIAILTQIAAQCPYTGGPAVYEARSLLAAHSSTDYDDQSICAAAGINYRQTKPKSPTTKEDNFKANLMPNPAATQVLLVFQNNAAQVGKICLLNALGQEVLSTNYSGNTHQILDIEVVVNGIYFVQFVSDANEITHIGKLSVVK